MKRIIALLLSIVFVAMALAGCSNGMSVEDARSGVVRIAVLGSAQLYIVDGGSQELVGEISDVLLGSGSGFGIGPAGEPASYFVTNRHVTGVEADGTFEEDGHTYRMTYRADTFYLLLDDNGVTDGKINKSHAVKAELVYQADADEPDLAVLWTNAPVEERIALPLRDPTSGIAQNTSVRAMGFPGSSDIATGVEQSGEYFQAKSMLGALDSMTITDGIVSLVGENAIGHGVCVQHTAVINSGNSGGPLITEEGAVVGVNTFTYTEAAIGDNTSPSLAVSSSELMKVLKRERIPYDLYKPGPSIMMIAIIGGAALLVIIIIVVVAGKSKKPAVPVQPEPEPEPKPQPTPIPPQPTPIPPPPPPPGPVTSDTAPRVQVIAGAMAGKRYSIEGVVRIGRDPGRNDIVFPQNTQGVSGVHCQLKVANGVLYLTDMGSTYGTFLGGGQRLAARQSVPLKHGDRFYLGSEKEVLQITGKGGV